MNLDIPGKQTSEYRVALAGFVVGGLLLVVGIAGFLMGHGWPAVAVILAGAGIVGVSVGAYSYGRSMVKASAASIPQPPPPPQRTL